MAATDGLTRCLNRSAFTSAVTAALAETANAETEITGALLVAGADHFKQINDRFGHQAGDLALRLIADGLREGLRETDIVGRLGGEEFGIFLIGADAAAANATAERLRWIVEDINLEIGGRRPRLTISVGGAIFAGPVPFGDLYHSADRHLHEAKLKGRNRVEIGPLSRPNASKSAAA
jgi:diguanylate cyclase (GGDEF)-like protein